MRPLSNIALAIALFGWPAASLAKDPAAAAEAAEIKSEDLGEPDEMVPSAENTATQYNTIVLQGLNKVTGHVSKLEGPVGTVMRFGNLEIIARRCWKSEPEDSPENAALLDIRELKPGEGSQSVFMGWMFSSSPGLSGLEHPVYDIMVLSCESSTHPETQEETKKPEDAKTEKPESTEKTEKKK